VSTGHDPFGLEMLPDPLPVEPVTGPLDAVVRLPGSKSITNRALVCAALAEGRSVLRGALLSDDTDAMAGVLRALGILLEIDAGELDDPSSPTIVVDGCAGRLPAASGPLDTRQSGTTSRFVLPLLTVGSGSYEVTSHPQMRARPMGTTFDALAALGAEVEALERPGHLPVRLRAPSATARQGPTELRVPGDVSSQFLSGLLLAGPCLPGGLRVVVTTELVSRPYVDLTCAVMARFGVEVLEPEPTVFVVPGSGYRAADLHIEADASAASYPLAAAAICGGRVRVQGLHDRALQGDARFARELAHLGATVSSTEHDGGSITVEAEAGALHGGSFDLRHLSDTAQTLAVVAPFVIGPVRIGGIGFIRRKEIDRVAAVATELGRCGVRVEVDADGWTIHPRADGSVLPTTFETYDDHRMAMSFALVGLRVEGIAIAGPACVAKTFPGYWRMLQGLQATGRAR
jgi:3-phosphoshikimate 1-carboxyvinyltransferase